MIVSVLCGGLVRAEGVSRPSSVPEAVRWLEAKSKEMIRASRRTMKSGIAAFPPQVGSGYEAFWLRDYAYMLEGCADAFSTLVDKYHSKVFGIVYRMCGPTEAEDLTQGFFAYLIRRWAVRHQGGLTDE